MMTDIEKLHYAVVKLKWGMEMDLRIFIDRYYEEILEYRKLNYKNCREKDVDLEACLDGMGKDVECELPYAINFFLSHNFLLSISR